MDFLNYQLAQQKEAAARARFETAVIDLELAGIRKRLAEIKSQYEPLATMNPEGNELARKKQVAAAHYVVYGFMPPLED
jgi:hypothetical protein